MEQYWTGNSRYWQTTSYKTQLARFVCCPYIDGKGKKQESDQWSLVVAIIQIEQQSVLLLTEWNLNFGSYFHMQQGTTREVKQHRLWHGIALNEFVCIHSSSEISKHVLANECHSGGFGHKIFMLHFVWNQVSSEADCLVLIRNFVPSMPKYFWTWFCLWDI